MFYANRKVLALIWLLFASFSMICAEDDQEKEVIWKPCDNDLNQSAVAKDIKVFVPQCPPVNGTESRCPLIKGHDAVIKIQFRPTQTVPTIERVIVARVPVSGKYVEMPYGPSVSPCDNSSIIAEDGSQCIDDGVVADKLYMYTSSFKVLKSFPTVQNISTRFIIRQKYDEHKKIRLYRKHPGPLLVCALIPNIEVTEETV